MAEEKTFSVGVQTSSPKRISVTSNVSENPITASADTGLYYSQLSKNWAIGDGLIQNEDYSSKTWAAESKRSADLSKMYSEAASLDYNNLSEAINQYNEQISGVVAEGLETINTSVTGGVETIETTKIEASEYVETTTNESIAEFDKAKSNAINAIEEAGVEVVGIISENGKSLPMYTYVWADHLYNDASYLRADTFSWHSADIYVTGYETLLEEYYNEGSVTQTENGVTYRLSPNGFKIADETQHDAILALYGTSNESWYYILDVPNTRFKLPREKSDKYLYFYVGNYSRPDTEVNLGVLTELANGRDLEAILEDINNTTNSGIASIESVTGAGVASVESATSAGITSLESKTNTGVSSLNNVITTGTTNLNNTISTGVSEIQATTKSGKAELNQIVADKVPPATVDTLGLVKPDGTSILIDELGTIFAEIPEVALATTSTAGIVKPDGSTITIADGIISAVAQSSSEFTYSKATSTWFRHNSGLMIQRGAYTTTAASSHTVTFPKAFSSANVTVITNNPTYPVINAPTASNFVINNTYKIANIPLHWIAFGY